jgi:indole-3-pyruvate monooxygenase
MAASKSKVVWVNGPIVVGAGPVGLSVAACLRARGVPSVVLDRAYCVASLWQRCTYDRLRLHLPRHICELPGIFPDDYPEYPTKRQFVEYLEAYAARSGVEPRFNQAVTSARYDAAVGLWCVRAEDASSAEDVVTEYIGRWLVVATGENAERIVPDFDSIEDFSGPCRTSPSTSPASRTVASACSLSAAATPGCRSAWTCAITMPSQPWLSGTRLAHHHHASNIYI